MVYQETITKNGVSRKTRSWYATATYRQCKVRLLACRDKRMSASFENKLRRLCQLREVGEPPPPDLTRWMDSLPERSRNRLAKYGLIDQRHLRASKLLGEHLVDFEQMMLDRGCTAKHASQTHRRVKRILTKIGAIHVSDLEPEGVQRAIASLADERVGPSTRHGIATAIKSFTRWLHRSGRVVADPLSSMEKPAPSRDPVRVPLSDKELLKLLKTTPHQPPLFGLSGKQRYWLYLLASETGLRRSELLALTRGDLDLDGDPPSAQLPASKTKSRRTARIPLRLDTVAELRRYVARLLPAARLFPVRASYRAAEALRADLEAAEIPYRDGTGRRRDFHSFRLGFVTRLARAGVHPRVAQQLARHSTINLTMEVYTSLGEEAEVRAVESLPALTQEAAG